MITAILILLSIQGAIGAFDVFYNHECVARLPRRPSAMLELRIHAVRAVLYAVVFIGLAWWEWHGLAALVFLILIGVEIGLTLWDFVVEDQTRRLSAQERLTHTVLAMNGGAYIALLGWVIFSEWWQQPSGLAWVNYGAFSSLLTLYGLGVFLSGLRDGWAGFVHLPRQVAR